MDQLLQETIVTLHPATLFSRQATAALRRAMAHYAGTQPVSYWAGVVTSPAWRLQRPNVITACAEQDWIDETDTISALQFAELSVMAAEAVAGQWQPEQCRIMAVRIQGTLRMSLVCSVG